MKIIYIFILCFIISSNIMAQGQTCATAVPLPIQLCKLDPGFTLATRGAGTPMSSCTDGAGQVWFSYTVPAGQTTINLTISGFTCNIVGCRGNIVVFNSCGGTEFGSICSIVAGSVNGTYTLSGVIPGNTYYILIGSTGNLGSNISAKITYVPEGQVQATAIALTNGAAPAPYAMCDSDGTGTYSGTNACGAAYVYERWFSVSIPTGCSAPILNLTNVNTAGGTMAVEFKNVSTPGCLETTNLQFGLNRFCVSGTSASITNSPRTFAITGNYFVVVSSSNPAATFSIDYDVYSGSAAQGATCASPYNLTDGDGIGFFYDSAHSTSNECAGVSTEDSPSLSVNCYDDSAIGATLPTVFTGSGCSPTIENSQYFSFQVPVDGTYSIYIAHFCSIFSRVKFFVADNLTCGTPNTASGFIGCSSDIFNDVHSLEYISLVSGNTYYIVTDGAGGTFCNYEILITTNPRNPYLDVKLLNFKVNKSKTGARITWTTGNESNNDFFELEFSTNGQVFQSVGKVHSKAIGGFSELPIDYEFDHAIDLSGVVYYRLKQFDKLGKFTYSPTRSIHLNTDKSFIQITPNPFENQLEITLNSDRQESMSITIFDISGKTQLVQKYETSEGTNLVNLNTHDLEKGMYILLVQNSKKNVVFQRKLVKF